MKPCEYIISVNLLYDLESTRIPCGRPSRRVSKDQHYCRKHFDAVIDEAKGAVVQSADKLRSYWDSRIAGDEWKKLCVRELCDTMDNLTDLGWEPGD